MRSSRRSRMRRVRMWLGGTLVVAAAALGGSWYLASQPHPALAQTPPPLEVAQANPAMLAADTPAKAVPSHDPTPWDARIQIARQSDERLEPSDPPHATPAETEVVPLPSITTPVGHQAAGLLLAAAPIDAALAPSPEPAPQTAAKPAASLEKPVSQSPAVAAAEKLVESGRWLEARRDLNHLLTAGLSAHDHDQVRSLAQRVSAETVLSKRLDPADTLVEIHKIESGQNLTTIGKKFDVPAEIIMRVNGIRDPGKLRADAKIKVPRGPFEARISKSAFRLDLYLRDTYVCSFPIAIGKDNGTPEGKWRVKERLLNPTYYPPQSAPDRRVIPPNDPRNPLGKYWIALEGIEGAAVGADGFGIHGTNEPDSIGKAVSLGCVRMRHEDIEFVFGALMPGKSTVMTLP